MRGWLLALLLLGACSESDGVRPDPARELADGAEFDDCQGGRCPRMVIVPGAPRFAISRWDVSAEQWDACVVGRGCGDDRGDAQEYARWLSGRTGRTYRSPTEAEWERALGAGATSEPGDGFRVVREIEP
jgi:formylglycine-generating enzyme required for sulfatase activity